MGLESLAILIRWLLDPLSRDFALTDLVVISAQVGHDSVLTKAFMEQIALPLRRHHQVRYIQAARAGRRITGPESLSRRRGAAR